MALGRVRAKQTRRGETASGRRCPSSCTAIPHLPARASGPRRSTWPSARAIAVGGTINIIVNNLLGFTTNPSEYACVDALRSDLAKRLPIPIFHVNAEDPEAVVRVAALALEYRYQFLLRCLIDLIGYRRHGHSEVDDPTITQPIVYAQDQGASAALRNLRASDSAWT